MSGNPALTTPHGSLIVGGFTQAGPVTLHEVAAAHVRALAALRQATWEATQFVTDEAIISYVQGVLREVESDAP